MSTETPTFPPGWKVFPLHPGTKEPIHKAWPAIATDDHAQIASWFIEHPGCNWAVAAGASGLGIIDIDGDVGEESLCLLEIEHGPLPDTREHATARGGRHLIFADPDKSLAPSASKVAKKIDTRGRNSYIVIPPSTFEGNSYAVTHDIPLAPVPSFVVLSAGSARQHVGASNGMALDTDTAIGRATALLQGYVGRSHVAVEGQGGDNLTYAVCAEVLNLGLSADKAFDLINTIWNVACVPPWDADELRAKIDNASQYAQNEPGAWAVPPARDRIPGEALDKLIAEADATPARGERSRFAWMDENEFTNLPPPQWLINDMMTRESVVLLYGPSGHYKSFLALGVGAGVAKTGECAFYVAAEGIARMARQDFPAWKLAHGEENELPFYMLEEMPSATDPADYVLFANSIRAKAAGRKVGVVFLDTLHAAMLGLEENSAKDMAVVLENAKFLKKALKCTVVLIHHTGQEGHLPRGSTALFAGVDTVLKVWSKPEVKLAQMFVVKQKNAQARPYPFSWEGKKYGPGLAFTPAEPKAVSILSDDANIFSPRSVGRALARLKATEPHTVSSQVLLMELVPQLENETEDQRNESLGRAMRGLQGAIKAGKLEGYHTGFGRGLSWSLPAATPDAS